MLGCLSPSTRAQAAWPSCSVGEDSGRSDLVLDPERSVCPVVRHGTTNRLPGPRRLLRVGGAPARPVTGGRAGRGGGRVRKSRRGHRCVLRGATPRGAVCGGPLGGGAMRSACLRVTGCTRPTPSGRARSWNDSPRICRPPASMSSFSTFGAPSGCGGVLKVSTPMPPCCGSCGRCRRPSRRRWGRPRARSSCLLRARPEGGTVGSIGDERTSHAEVVDRDRVETQPRALAERVGWRARERGVGARVITVKVRTAGLHTVQRSRSGEAVAEERELFRVVLELLPRAWVRRRPVRLVGVQLSNVEGPGPQLALPLPSARAFIGAALDAVRARVGYDAVRLGPVGRSRWQGEGSSGPGEAPGSPSEGHEVSARPDRRSR